MLNTYNEILVCNEYFFWNLIAKLFLRILLIFCLWFDMHQFFFIYVLSKSITHVYKNYSPSHIVLVTDFLEFLHEYCKEISEIFTEF